jgi:hypothetical protein
LEGEYKVIGLRQQAEVKRTEQIAIELAKLTKLVKEKKDGCYQIDIQLQKCEIRLQNILGQGTNKAEIEAKQHKLKQLQEIQKNKLEMLKSLQAQLTQVTVCLFILTFNTKCTTLRCLCIFRNIINC